MLSVLCCSHFVGWQVVSPPLNGSRSPHPYRSDLHMLHRLLGALRRTVPPPLATSSLGVFICRKDRCWWNYPLCINRVFLLLQNSYMLIVKICFSIYSLPLCKKQRAGIVTTLPLFPGGTQSCLWLLSEQCSLHHANVEFLIDMVLLIKTGLCYKLLFKQ